MQDGHGYASHPILRDHFRSLLIDESAATARRAADLLQGTPSDQQPFSLHEVEPVLLAIELLLEADVFSEADELYRARLDNGRLFLHIPALAEGFHCVLGFVGDETRRQQCEKKLGRERLAFYVNDVGLFASNAGHNELAAIFYAHGTAMDREMKDSVNLSIGLNNQARLLVYLGRLATSVENATQSLDSALQIRDNPGIVTSYARRGWALTLSGQAGSATHDFAIANALEKKIDPNVDDLYSVRGVDRADFLLRTGHPALAAGLTKANLLICEHNRWNEDVARCHRVLAACALALGEFVEAEGRLQQAEPVFQSGQMLFELAQVHVIAGQVSLARRVTTDAIRRSAKALALAQPRGMRLIHADALVLRGQSRLMEATPPGGKEAGAGEPNDSLLRALDDADEGLRIARDCGYAWAERDALFLQADAHTALSSAFRAADDESSATRHRNDAYRIRQEAEAFASRLRLTEDDLAQADAKAAEWLEQWEKETAENP